MTNLQLLRKLAQEWGPTDSTGKVTAWAAEEIKRLDADAAGVQAELASVKLEAALLRRQQHQLNNELTAATLECGRLQAQIAEDDKTLRSSVPERWKDCTSPVGAVQSYIAELEQRAADEPCAQLSHKQLELKAVEALRRACSSLTDDAVLPARMTFPLGDVGAYGFELRVAMKSGPARQSPADLVGARQDRVHEDTGAVRAGHAVKSGASHE